MRDFHYVDELGQETPTGSLPTKLLEELARDGIKIVPGGIDDGVPDVDLVLLRIRLEIEERRRS